MVAALLLVRLLDETASFLPAGALEGFRDDFGLTYAQAGAVLAAIGPGSIAGVAAVAASDRVGRRPVVVGGALAYAASMLAFAAGGSFGVLVAAGFLVGVASTAMVDASEVALADLAGDRLRILLARQNLAGVAGDLLGPSLLVAVSAAGLGWRVAFAAAAVLLVAYAALLARHPLPPPIPEPDAPSPAGALLGALRDRRVWALGLASVLLVPLDEPLVAFAVALLEEGRAAPPAVAATAAIAVAAGSVVTFLLLAPRIEGRDDARVLGAAGLLVAGSVAAFGALPGVLALAALFGAGVGLDLAWLVVQHRTLTVRAGAVGTVKAVVSTVELAGFALPVVVGAVVDRFGLGAGVGAFAALGGALAALAAGLRGQGRDSL